MKLSNLFGRKKVLGYLIVEIDYLPGSMLLELILHLKQNRAYHSHSKCRSFGVTFAITTNTIV